MSRCLAERNLQLRLCLSGLAGRKESLGIADVMVGGEHLRFRELRQALRVAGVLLQRLA